ncbi:LysE family translocator [Tropicimonas sp. IMCC34043]|uniref:LysE family translocator n=1 Tax=Tropicimonas sp. IMCC34043 TaxID=2248760 RepID=UPI000E21E20D|nr:LysE family translocator [Tropicimonas sp. IMCC34043]
MSAMSPETFSALVALAAVAAFTPGPNNALLASSGATFGLRRTVPHVLGVALGFPVMIFLVGYFLGGLFQTVPVFREALRWIGAAVLLWMAWKLGHTGAIVTARGEPRPFTFIEAAGFQWINPKGWAMAIAITAQFVLPEAPLRSAAIVALVFVALGLGSAASWAVLGQGITLWARDERRMRRFNLVMALLLVGCVGLLLLD